MTALAGTAKKGARRIAKTRPHVQIKLPRSKLGNSAPVTRTASTRSRAIDHHPMAEFGLKTGRFASGLLAALRHQSLD
jgi:hypothetical protein